MSAPQISDPSERTNIAKAIAEVSERASMLVREEIELAKAEMTQKATRIAKGAIVGAAAGMFVLTALFFALVGLAWLIYFEVPIGNDFTYFWGFFIMAAILLLLGAIAGLLAAKALKSGAPPTPSMAIEEARKIRETVSAGSEDPVGVAAEAPVGVAAEAPVGVAAEVPAEAPVGATAEAPAEWRG